MTDTIGQESSACSGQSSRDEQIANAKGKLTFCVEEREIDCTAWEQATFDQSEKESTGYEATV